MSKREEYESSDTAVVETLRSASRPVEARKSDDEKISLFWRVFGGTIISVAALAAITLFNTMNGSIAELRAEVARLNEVKVDAAKKEDVATLRSKSDDNRRELDGQKERLSKYHQELDVVRKDAGTATDAVKKDLTAVEKELQKAMAEVREKVARLEGQQTPMKSMPPAGEGK